ncbi:hypothetical protein DPEC_G00243590 [Dallia pectoralis]|uniref:Uncharacterized protein n=1 Tax=Dallia pectoralis TaxID=75939 RepID=A0ACC2FVA9_DALPE|nr:hypothetical protein DPEC_G00243590 [Dallia pectoralis]
MNATINLEEEDEECQPSRNTGWDQLISAPCVRDLQDKRESEGNFRGFSESQHCAKLNPSLPAAVQQSFAQQNSAVASSPAPHPSHQPSPHPTLQTHPSSVPVFPAHPPLGNFAYKAIPVYSPSLAFVLPNSVIGGGSGGWITREMNRSIGGALWSRFVPPVRSLHAPKEVTRVGGVRIDHARNVPTVRWASVEESGSRLSLLRTA